MDSEEYDGRGGREVVEDAGDAPEGGGRPLYVHAIGLLLCVAAFAGATSLDKRLRAARWESPANSELSRHLTDKYGDALALARVSRIERPSWRSQSRAVTFAAGGGPVGHEYYPCAGCSILNRIPALAVEGREVRVWYDPDGRETFEYVAEAVGKEIEAALAAVRERRIAENSWQCRSANPRPWLEASEEAGRLADFWRRLGATVRLDFYTETRTLRLGGEVDSDTTRRMLVEQFKAVGGVCQVEEAGLEVRAGAGR